MKKIAFIAVCIFLLVGISPLSANSREENLNVFYLQETSDDHLLKDTTHYLNMDLYSYTTFRIDEGWEQWFLEQKDLYPMVIPVEVISLPITKYFQNNQPWSPDIMYSAELSIQNYGCTLTSYTMIASRFGYSYDPGEVNTIMGTKACPFSWTTAKSRFGINYEKLGTDNNLSLAKVIILDALRQNRPVIVCYERLDIPGRYHYVVAHRYSRVIVDGSEQEFFHIYDPSEHKDYQYLEDYLTIDNKPWKILSLRVFH